MPNTYALRCASCGAPLSVPSDATQFACRHCGNEQRLESAGDTLRLTSAVNAIGTSTERAAAELSLPRVERETQRCAQMVSAYKQALQVAQHELKSAEAKLNAEQPVPRFTLESWGNLGNDDSAEKWLRLVGAIVVSLPILYFAPNTLYRVGGSAVVLLVFFWPAVPGYFSFRRWAAGHTERAATERSVQASQYELAKSRLAECEQELAMHERNHATKLAELQHLKSLLGAS